MGPEPIIKSNLVCEDSLRLSLFDAVVRDELVESEPRQQRVSTVGPQRLRSVAGRRGRRHVDSIESFAGGVDERQLRHSLHVPVGQQARVRRKTARRHHAHRPHAGPHASGHPDETAGEDSTKFRRAALVRAQVLGRARHQRGNRVDAG